MHQGGLAPDEIDRFTQDGFVHVRGAFAREVADAGRARLWQELESMGIGPDTWTEPVVRLAGSNAAPFDEAVNTERLRRCFDQLVGPGRWVRRTGLGTFPIRFPVAKEPDDTGWHCDGGFGEWPYRLNVRSRGRALLMLFLFSDVGTDDAPTRIRVGSHLDVPGLLEPHGEDGRSAMDLASELAPSAARPVSHATGSAGDVYLCHPFLVHAAQAHRGTEPRFMAQPPLVPVNDLRIDRAEGPLAPVELAIRQGLGRPA